jgi:tetrapyrrole methylase family protein/MazG family protein
MDKTSDAASAFQRFTEIIARLRAPDGCPWDREQTPRSLRGSLIEETYECVEAIDGKDPGHIREELGDVFLLVTMMSYMHQQEGSFTIEEVLDGICDKLIRRHPHVFAGVSVANAAEALDNWARIKVEQEGRKPKDSVLDDVSRGLPPLDRAYKLQKKAAKAGFDWPDREGVIAKIEEELEEVREAAGTPEGERLEGERLENELGDLLFSVVNLCRSFGVEPSLALQRTNITFERRFRHVEKRMKEAGAVMNGDNLAMMDALWEEAKREEKPHAP